MAKTVPSIPAPHPETVEGVGRLEPHFFPTRFLFHVELFEIRSTEMKPCISYAIVFTFLWTFLDKCLYFSGHGT